MNPEEFIGDGNFASLVATHLGFAERARGARGDGDLVGGGRPLRGLRPGGRRACARTVLVVGGEKMTHLATPRVSEIIGRSIDPYERAYGTTMPALAGPHHPRAHAPPRR